MTNAYNHPGLVADNLSSECRSWLHSAVRQVAFLSPWQAIQNAEDLAVDVGYDNCLRIDDFQLTRPKRTAAKISFL